MAELVNVPDVDGVPEVLFAAGAGLGVTLAVADDPLAVSAFVGFNAQRWGLYGQGGSPVIEADCIAAFDHKREWVISDYPVERGAFESYDKVSVPFDVRLVYCAGGSEENRAALLRSVDAIAGDLNLYDAVTPEKVFQSVNVVHHDFSRTSQRGVGLLTVALWCREVREITNSSGTSNPSAAGGTGQTASPSGADPVDGGVVQPRDATPSEMSSVATQDFSGGYNVSGYSVPEYTADVGEAVFTDPSTGQEVGRVPGSSAVPQTSSSISGLSPAGPDQFSSRNVGSVPGIS